MGNDLQFEVRRQSGFSNNTLRTVSIRRIVTTSYGRRPAARRGTGGDAARDGVAVARPLPCRRIGTSTSWTA
ncbi:MAG: hypothetical protein ACK5BN_18135 [Planctomycetota bacterium]